MIKDIENTGMRVESIISFEEEDDSLLDIDLATGQTVGTHRLGKSVLKIVFLSRNYRLYVR